MTSNASVTQNRNVALAAAGVALPVFVFYALLLRFVLNIPVLDDYDAALSFLNQLVTQPSAAGKFLLFLSTQHNEYKTLFGNGVVWLQFVALHHVDFRVMSMLGNVFVLLIGVLLWKMFLPQCKDLATRLSLFIPVSLLLFQLNYVEAVNAPMAALQYWPALSFSLTAIYLLVKSTKAGFYAALVLIFLSIFSSTNGFLLIPIGLLLLGMRRQYVRMALVLADAVVSFAIYRYHYVVIHSQTVGQAFHSFLVETLILKPVYALCVLGNAVGYPFGLAGAGALGLAICVFYFVLAKRGFFRRNPAIGYCAMFLVLTSMGIASIRLSLGMQFSTSSRYRMYSDLLLVFAWFAVVEEFLLPKMEQQVLVLRRNWIFVTAILLSGIFAIGSDRWGYKFLKSRRTYWIQGIAAYEHPAFPGSTEGPVLRLPQQNAQEEALQDQLDQFCRKALVRSIQLGIYVPPQY